jgi:hypothetical protein
LLSSNLVSSVGCPSVYQGIWRVTDCCTNSTTCTQTVTVVVMGPAIIPVISGIHKDTAGVHITFQSQPCYQYALECKDSLVSGTWNLCQTLTGDGTILEFLEPSPLSKARFYRVRVICPP